MKANMKKSIKVLHRERISTARDLGDLLQEIDRLFPQTGDKYLSINGEYVVSVEVTESTLMDGSLVYDIELITEVTPKPQ